MENTNQTPPSLTLNDLAVLRNVIEVAISRGAFKADEITSVGQTYDKLKTWLDAIVQQAAEQTAETTPAEEPTTTSTATKQKGKK